MQYTFDGDIAKQYGLDEAVFIQNLFWWIAKNEANNKHYHDGRYWTYNTMTAYTKLFPFWSKKQVRRIVDKLKGLGIVHTGNYNQKGFDQTIWYALSDEVYAMCLKGQMDVPKKANASAQTGTPIPDINTDILLESINRPTFGEFWNLYPRHTGKADAEKAFAKLNPDAELFETIKTAIEQQKTSEQWTKDRGQYIPYPATWLNGKRWQDEIGGDTTGQANIPVGETSIAKRYKLDIERY